MCVNNNFSIIVGKKTLKYCYDDFLRAILLRKISEFPSGTRTHNLLIAEEQLEEYKKNK